MPTIKETICTRARYGLIKIRERGVVKIIIAPRVYTNRNIISSLRVTFDFDDIQSNLIRMLCVRCA